MYLRIHSIIMYLLRTDNMATSGYSFIVTPIAITLTLFIHSAITATGNHHHHLSSSLYIYLLSLDLYIVKSLLERKYAWAVSADEITRATNARI